MATLRSILISCLILIVLFGGYCRSVLTVEDKSQDVNEPIALIQDDLIALGEFKLFFYDNKAKIMSEYKEYHDVDLDGDLWWEDFNGKVPGEQVVALTLDQIFRIKYEQSIQRSSGIVEDISYERFLSDLTEENEERQYKLDSGIVIYGPMQYDEKVYFQYVHQVRMIELNKILSDKIKVSEEELTYYYEDHKNEIYKKPDYIKVTIIRDDSIGGEMERIFDEASYKYDIRHDASLYYAVENIQVGERVEFSDGTDMVVTIDCLERKEGGHYSFETCRQSIYDILYDNKYDEYIDSGLKEAERKVLWDSFNLFNKVHAIIED